MNHQVGFSASGGDSRVIRKRDGVLVLKPGVANYLGTVFCCGNCLSHVFFGLTMAL